VVTVKQGGDDSYSHHLFETFQVQRESFLDNKAIAETVSLRHSAGENPGTNWAGSLVRNTMITFVNISQVGYTLVHTRLPLFKKNCFYVNFSP